MKLAIVFTGIVNNYCVDSFIEHYKDIDITKYIKIISTWNNADTASIDKLRANDFMIIQSTFPDNIAFRSSNYQHFSYLHGIKFARNLGATHVLRMRSDMYCTNITRMLEIYQELYCNKPIFITYYTHDGGYLIDYACMFALTFYDNFTFTYQTSDDPQFTEKYLQETYFGSSEWNGIEPQITLSLKLLLENDIDFLWLKQEYIEHGKQIERYLNSNFECKM